MHLNIACPQPVTPNHLNKFDSLQYSMKSGVLASQAIRDFVDGGTIRAPIKIHPEQVQPASIDLRVGKRAWRVPASFLVQNGNTVIDEIRNYGDAVYRVDLTKKAFLEAGKTYVLEILEELRLPRDIFARSNPKSSSGRIDVFVRLVTEKGHTFDQIPAGYKGKLFLILFSNSFDVLIKQGVSLNQLRFFSGGGFTLSSNELRMLHTRNPLLFTKEGKPMDEPPIKESGLFLGLDLDDDISGYRSKKNADPIDLTKVGTHLISEFWEPIYRPEAGSLILDPHYFYVLKSKQRVSVPIDYAAEMVEFHSGIGEFRSHYAGFFDPGFGFGRAAEIKGSHAVLEVRMRDLPMKVFDGQVFVKLVFERLVSIPDVVYGIDVHSNYQNQVLKLSKHFGD